MVLHEGFEPSHTDLESAVLPIKLRKRDNNILTGQYIKVHTYLILFNYIMI